MKRFEIVLKKQGAVLPISFGALYSDNLKHARKEFAQWVWDGLQDNRFGDNFTWHNDESIQDEMMECRDVSWYVEQGWYDVYTKELVLADKALGNGFDSWSEDVYTYWIREITN